MSFRKRSIPLANIASSPAAQSSNLGSSSVTGKQTLAPGVRLSPTFSVPTTSTGLASLDSLLRLNAGLALASCLVIEEDGTTDYAGAILRCFASEGVLQGHKVFIAALEQWAAGLPGLAVEKEKREKTVVKESSPANERMNIAWRYERMGLHGDTAAQISQSSLSTLPFCHTFDLSTRLSRPATSPQISFNPPRSHVSNHFPDLVALSTYMAQNPAHVPVRLVIPGLLSPLSYHPTCSAPMAFIRFLRDLVLLRKKHDNLCVMISWPLALYGTSNTLTWWLERLCDGVIRLEPFPHGFSIDAIIPQKDSLSNKTGTKQEDEKIQGLLRVLKLPIITDRGMGTGVAEDMAWALGRQNFTIRPFNLPPLEAGLSNEAEMARDSKVKDLDF